MNERPNNAGAMQLQQDWKEILKDISKHFGDVKIDLVSLLKQPPFRTKTLELATNLEKSLWITYEKLSIFRTIESIPQNGRWATNFALSIEEPGQ